MMKFLTVLLILLLIIPVYTQDLESSEPGNPGDRGPGMNATRPQPPVNEGDINLDENNQNQPEPENASPSRDNTPAVNASQTLTPETAPSPYSYPYFFKHYFGGMLGLGYNRLYNEKSRYSDDGIGFNLAFHYMGFFSRIKENIQFGLSFKLGLNSWITPIRSEEYYYGYIYKIDETPDCIALELSLMPVFRYNNIVFGLGVYLNFTSTSWKLFDDDINNFEMGEKYSVNRTPKFKKQDFGITAMFAWVYRGNAATMLVGMELRFSVNKPVLYYDYYNTGSFPYIQRGGYLGDGNYFSILLFISVGGVW